MQSTNYALRRQIDRLARNRAELRDHPIYNQPTQPYNRPEWETTTVLCLATELAELQQIIRDTIVNIQLLEEARPTKKRPALWRRIFRK